MAGALVGLISGGALGFAANKYREKEQQKQQIQQLELRSYFDQAEADGTVVNNPEWQKRFKKMIGDDDAYNAAITHFKVHAGTQQRQQQQQQKFLAALGIGAPPQAIGSTQSGDPSMAGQPPQIGPAPAAPQASMAPSGPPPSGGTAAPVAPNYPQQIQKLIAAKASLASEGFSPDFIKSSSAAIDAEIKLAFEQMKAQASSPEEKVAIAKAEAQARLEVNTDPANVKRLAGAKAAEEGAGESARLGVETSPAAISGAARKASAEASAKLGVEGSPEALDTLGKRTEKEASVKAQVAAKTNKPWTPKDALTARKSALDQAKAELVTAGWFGNVRQATGEKVSKHASDILAAEGLNPSGQKFKDGDTVQMSDGKTYVWRDSK